MKKLASLVLVICLPIILLGCSSEKKFGFIPDSMRQSSVKDIVLNPASAGTEVLVRGTIKTQCASNGCWFFLDDGTGQILILLNALNLGLPQSVGKSADVYGIVSVVNQQAAISARGLKVK